MSATRSIADLPGPRGLPLLGNLHQTWWLPRSHEVVERWAERYGPIFKFRVGARLIVVVSDEDEVNRILRDRPAGYRRWPEVEEAFGGIGFLGVFKSVVNGMTLQALTDTTVRGTAIPAGTRLLTAFRSVGRAAGGPEFRPERWLSEGGAPDRKSFLAFGAGPRFCPGRNLAFLEAKSALATIARGFELELDPDAGEVRERLAFMVVPEGLRIRVRERTPD